MDVSFARDRIRQALAQTQHDVALLIGLRSLGSDCVLVDALVESAVQSERYLLDALRELEA